jgi:hypothetical protein
MEIKMKSHKTIKFIIHNELLVGEVLSEENTKDGIEYYIQYTYDNDVYEMKILETFCLLEN